MLCPVPIPPSRHIFPGESLGGRSDAFLAPISKEPPADRIGVPSTWLAVPALPQSPGKRIFDLEETLGTHSEILQALQGLSKQLAQAERQWKKQLGFPGLGRPEGAWVSGPLNIHIGLEKLSSPGTGPVGSLCPGRGASAVLGGYCLPRSGGKARQG